jgi:hypothetical protein
MNPDAAKPTHRISAWLQRQPSAVLAVWAMVGAFAAYGSMYAFRKPFSAATYAGTFWGLDYKTLLVLTQLVGYTVSKFLGIKFVSEATATRRVAMVLGLIGFAELALILFAIVPAPWNAAFLFLNGLPLGMVWGLIFAFLEGRRVTEWMVLGLSLSLIFSSAWVKSVGLLLMHAWGVSEFWMPAATGACFLPVLLGSLWMLAVLPPPNAADIAARTLRQPMDREARHAFLRQYWLGVTLLVAGYMGIMTYRDVRDTFQVDILRELGVIASAGQLAAIETKVGILVIATLGLFSLIKSNRHAFTACCGLVGLGGLVIGFATLLLQKGMLGPQAWMATVGVGLYAAFVAYQAIVFERLLASLRVVGTASFLIVVSDSYGYLSTIALYFYKVFGGAHVSWVRVTTLGGYALAVLLPLLMLATVLVFARKKSLVSHILPAPSPSL